MSNTIFVKDEVELRSLFEHQNSVLQKKDKIILKNDITLSNNLIIDKEIVIGVSNGKMLFTGQFELQFRQKN